jgi:hypothetical protein
MANVAVVDGGLLHTVSNPHSLASMHVLLLLLSVWLAVRCYAICYVRVH